MTHAETLKAAGLTEADLAGGTLAVHSPIDGAEVARVRETQATEMDAIIARAQAAFRAWREVPAPRRGELVRLLGEELRATKAELGAVVTLEAGKIVSEGLGEVQEMIDICDFAVGLSRQLYGLTIASERPGHRMMETWHPMGPCAVITAFNFPVAVWSWNTALALVCGDPVIWKPSEKTPLTALTCMKILERALARFGDAPEGLVQLVIGGAEVGEALVNSRDVPIVSATGSTRMGRIVGPKVAERFGRAILELGGNNAMIVAPSADMDMAVRAIVFSAVGTAGQRCTSLRRLIITATPAQSPILQAEWVADGTHIVAVGSDSPGKQELDPDLAARCTHMIVDDAEQCLAHGEFGHASRKGHLETSGYRLLGQYLLEGHQSCGAVSIVDLTGLGAQDLAIASTIYEKIAHAC